MNFQTHFLRSACTNSEIQYWKLATGFNEMAEGTNTKVAKVPHLVLIGHTHENEIERMEMKKTSIRMREEKEGGEEEFIELVADLLFLLVVEQPSQGRQSSKTKALRGGCSVQIFLNPLPRAACRKLLRRSLAEYLHEGIPVDECKNRQGHCNSLRSCLQTSSTFCWSPTIAIHLFFTMIDAHWTSFFFD